eukprot:TRINITY_DN10301_c1_g1_i1.p1 TRINITY_DN10301_c1_g1~~TRINITY_DN10301_c1_g1_i1.p1  ORF type:complete len:2284 (+),score=869.31 TRINITY_DN10301_c1_g1_i1:820-7671(+)
MRRKSVDMGCSVTRWRCPSPPLPHHQPRMRAALPSDVSHIFVCDALPLPHTRPQSLRGVERAVHSHIQSHILAWVQEPSEPADLSDLFGNTAPHKTPFLTRGGVVGHHTHTHTPATSVRGPFISHPPLPSFGVSSMYDGSSDESYEEVGPTFALNGHNGNGHGAHTNGNGAATRVDAVMSGDDDDDSSSDFIARRRRPASSSTAPRSAPAPRASRHRIVIEETQSDAESDDEESEYDEEGEEGEEDEEDEEEEESSSGYDSEHVRPPAPYHDLPITEKQFAPQKKLDVILGHRPCPTEDDPEAEEYLCKFLHRSYHHVEWLDATTISTRYSDRKLANYIDKHVVAKPAGGGSRIVKTEEELEAASGDGHFDRQYLEADRIVAKGQDDAGRWHFLIKWNGLPYNEATWEKGDFVKNTLGLDVLIARFNNWSVPPVAPNNYSRPKMTSGLLDRITGAIRGYTFLNDCKLRDYQEQGIAWLAHNWLVKTNCILGDEMGLGKTVQVIIFFETLRRFQSITGPFLVVAPLATLGHWGREAALWTDMNVVTYLGNKEARDRIFMNEFFFRTPASTGAIPRSNSKVKFNVLITTYEWLVRDAARMKGIHWASIVIDEGHRLKNEEASLFKALTPFKTEFRCVLTGTPVQNRLGELYALLKHLDPRVVEKTEEKFLQRFTPLTEERLADLFSLLGSRLLRREKGHVEKSIPPKVEILVKVPLSKAQREVYKLVLEGKRDLLASKQSAGKAQRHSQNLCMELRKVCNHPWLIDDQEERAMETLGYAAGTTPPYDLAMETMLRQSSKMLFLDKLLGRLRKEGNKVLIFSQFVMVLSLIEEFLAWRGYPFETLTGNTNPFARQAAVDRFQDPNNTNAFIFLISTKAGGCGINLTAASKVIIYDSDWNPQNDLQAQARCHRIGQKKEVEVYRILTENTYEEKMFEVASQKLGLDHVILAAASKTKGKDAKATDAMGLTTDEIERVLRHGAYDLYKNNNEDDVEVDIDAILEKSKKIIHGGESQEGAEKPAEAAPEEEVQAVRGLAGFSKVTFKIDGKDQIENDPEFWSKVLPERLSVLSLGRRLNGAHPPDTAEEVAAFIEDLRTVSQEDIASLGSGPLCTQEKVQTQHQLEQLITQLLDLSKYKAHHESLKVLLEVAIEPRKRVRNRGKMNRSSIYDSEDASDSEEDEEEDDDESNDVPPPMALPSRSVRSFGGGSAAYEELCASDMGLANRLNRRAVLSPWKGKYLRTLCEVTRRFGYGHFSKVVEALKEQGAYPEVDLLDPAMREGAVAAQLEQILEYISDENLVKIDKPKGGKKKASDSDSVDTDITALEVEESSSDEEEEGAFSKVTVKPTLPLYPANIEVSASDHRGKFNLATVRKKYAQMMEVSGKAIIREYRMAELVHLLRQHGSEVVPVDTAKPVANLRVKVGEFDRTTLELSYGADAAAAESLYTGAPVEVSFDAQAGVSKYLVCACRIFGKVKKSARLYRSYVVRADPPAPAADAAADAPPAEVPPLSTSLVLPGCSGTVVISVVPLRDVASPEPTESLTLAAVAALQGVKANLLLPVLMRSSSVACVQLAVANREALSQDESMRAAKQLPSRCHLRRMRERVLSPSGAKLLESPVAEYLLFTSLTTMNAFVLLNPTPKEEDLALTEAQYLDSDLTYFKTRKSEVFCAENFANTALIVEHTSAILAQYMFKGYDTSRNSKFTRPALLAMHRLAAVHLEKSTVNKKVFYTDESQSSGKSSTAKENEKPIKEKEVEKGDADEKKRATADADALSAVAKKACDAFSIVKADSSKPYSASNAKLDFATIVKGVKKTPPEQTEALFDALVSAVAADIDKTDETKKAVASAKADLLEVMLQCNARSEKVRRGIVDTFEKNLETSVQLFVLLGQFFDTALKGAADDVSPPHMLGPFRQLYRTLFSEVSAKVKPKTWKAKQEFSLLEAVLKHQQNYDAVFLKATWGDHATVGKKQLQSSVIPTLLRILKKEIPLLVLAPLVAPTPTKKEGKPDAKAAKKGDDKPAAKAAKKEDEKPAVKAAAKKRKADDADVDVAPDGETPPTKKPATKKPAAKKASVKKDAKPAAKKDTKAAAKKSTAKPAAKKSAAKPPAKPAAKKQRMPDGSSNQTSAEPVDVDADEPVTPVQEPPSTKAFVKTAPRKRKEPTPVPAGGDSAEVVEQPSGNGQTRLTAFFKQARPAEKPTESLADVSQTTSDMTVVNTAQEEDATPDITTMQPMESDVTEEVVLGAKQAAAAVSTPVVKPADPPASPAVTSVETPAVKAAAQAAKPAAQ